MAERFKPGIKEMEDVIPGLPMPSVTLVRGSPGAGKTVFSLAAMSVKGLKKLAVLTNNTPAELQGVAKDVGIDVEGFQWLDCYSWLAGKKAAVDSLANLARLLSVIEDSLPEGGLVLLDPLTPLMLYNSEDAVERFVQEFAAIVKAKNCVSFITLDSGSYSQGAENTFAALCDSVIELDSAKGLRFVKMLDTRVPDKWFFYEIAEKGFRLRAK
jgi:archaellum biogenesis ATPase FlaH